MGSVKSIAGGVISYTAARSPGAGCGAMARPAVSAAASVKPSRARQATRREARSPTCQGSIGSKKLRNCFKVQH